ncbi:Thermophilic metalloprotease (M29) [uncultured archaeon]|nr:Thermophilic metalloprotease (M29) [uncultured archaeon]
MVYEPPKEVLEKYANVLISCALNSGAGVKHNEVVLLQVPECAKPILLPLQRAVLRAGAHPIIQYLPDGISREFYDLAGEHQINFFPSKYLKGRVDEIDHLVSIIAEHDMHELEGVDPKRLMAKQKAFKPYMEWRDEKENSGKFTWTLGLYGTEVMAAEAKLSLEEYWDQIIKACYLDREDPLAEWRRVLSETERLTQALSAMQITSLHVQSVGADLTIGLDRNRKWLGGTGRNIPSFEVFTSPDCRKTNGYMTFNQPLYRYGTLVEGIYLEFKDGKVVKATAKKNQDVLEEMIATEGANMIGEFSLTDVRFSKIDKFMAETLYDENFGGEHGNTHIAVGNAYKDAFPGDPSKVPKEQWKEMGYNESVVHTDIVSTENRVVTATLEDGTQKVIYQDGKFTI